MRTNPIQTREGDIREVIKATFSTFIPQIWYGCYQIPKLRMRNFKEFSIPVMDESNAEIVLSRSRLEVKWRDELYIVDWFYDERFGQCSEFLLSSNWGSQKASQILFPKVITTLTGHLLHMV